MPKRDPKKLQERALARRNAKSHVTSPSKPIFDINGSYEENEHPLSRCLSPGPFRLAYSTHFSPNNNRVKHRHDLSKVMKKSNPRNKKQVSSKKTTKKHQAKVNKTTRKITRKGKPKSDRNKATVLSENDSPLGSVSSYDSSTDPTLNEFGIPHDIMGPISPEMAARMAARMREPPPDSPSTTGPVLYGGSPLFSPEKPPSSPPLTIDTLYEFWSEIL